MPKVNNQTEVTIEETPQRGGLRGRMDVLIREFSMKAEALKIAVSIIDADDRQTAMLEMSRKVKQALNHRAASAPQALPPHKRQAAPKMARAERLVVLTDYLAKNPGATTNEIADALGMQSNRALVLAHDVAKGTRTQKAQGRGAEFHWTLKKSAAKKAAKKKPALAASSNGHKPSSKIVNAKTRPHEDWQADVRAYLTDHPEAYTTEIAKALRRTPNSGFIKLVRTVARPARATTKTQPIPWVLADAAS